MHTGAAPSNPWIPLRVYAGYAAVQDPGTGQPVCRGVDVIRGEAAGRAR
ncbi:hypothetical protein [Paenibacillus sambharensis]|nr:hypothetical protein [Paenibacillus sambharensis]